MIGMIGTINSGIVVVIVENENKEKVQDKFETLREKMHEHVVHFKYEKADGSVREAFGTLKENLVKVQPQGVREVPDSVFTYWDLEADGWRCFRKDRYIGEVE